MKNILKDIPLLTGFSASMLLIYLSFNNSEIFWYLYTAAMLFLMSFVIITEKAQEEKPSLRYVMFGLFTGLLLYGVFWMGNQLILLLNLPFHDDVLRLYRTLSPTLLWHYAVLILIIVPGEEIFWRGFIQKRLLKFISPASSVLLSAILYTIPLLFAHNILLIVSGIVGGLVWSWLYYWKRSLTLVILSHLVFDIMLLIILPFN